MKKEKKKIEFKNIVLFVVLMAVSVLLGLYIGATATFPDTASADNIILEVGIEILLLYFGFFLHLVIHEGGHLVFGLLTGYRFVSFRIGGLMIVRTKEGMKFRRMSLAGTGGQCLLSPPPIVDGKYPYVLYNFGGALMNVLFSLPFIPFLFNADDKLWFFSAVMVFLGLFIALSNAIPIKTKDIANDGYNALHIGDDKNALKAMHQQLEINALQMEGIRLKDMPEELFEVTEGANHKNALISTIEVMKENRLMDEKRFDEALMQIERCLSDEMNTIGIYRVLLKLDRYCIELMKDPESAHDQVLSESVVKQVMNAMKENPSFIRVKILDAALKKKNDKDKEKWLAFFDKVTPHYPAQGDVQVEREIINLALADKQTE